MQFVCVLQFAGCVRSSYRYGVGERGHAAPPLASNPIQYGGDHPRLDRVERTLDYPRQKFAKWFGKDHPKKDPEQQRLLAIEASVDFLQANELGDVCVDVREYAPSQQWARLKANRRIHPIWKYTAGSMSIIGYSLLPGRVFHSDGYNVYTDTLSLNSTDPALALYEAATAKQYRKHHYLGSYAVAQNIPLVPIRQKSVIAGDVLTYARQRQRWDLEKPLYPIAYGNIANASVQESLALFPIAGDQIFVVPVVSLVGNGIGHGAGTYMAKKEEKKLFPNGPPSADAPSQGTTNSMSSSVQNKAPMMPASITEIPSIETPLDAMEDEATRLQNNAGPPIPMPSIDPSHSSTRYQ